MKKRKWLKRFIIIVIILALLGGGAAAGIRYWLANRGSAVEVYNVSDINAAQWIGYGDMDGTSGTVVSDVSQSVKVPDDKVINEVYVEEGDPVKIGDKLLSYDTTLLELDQELQELTVQEIGLEIKSAEADLQKLRNTTPVERSDYEEDYYDDYGDYEDYGDLDWYWDEEMDEARLISGERAMMAVQEGAEVQSETEQMATETVAVVEEESEQFSEHIQTEYSESSSDAVQQNSEQMLGNEQGIEQILGDDQEGIIENLTPEELNNAPIGGVTEEGSLEELLGGAEADRPKLNQSLYPFLNNIRIKEETEDQTETLLADTNDYEKDSTVTVNITGGNINIIPHFKEDTENRFVKLNTYLMYIKGIQLKEDLAGKIYGTAIIDGNDYPEIGGFTCVQEEGSGAEDVVKLTLAFHEGLEEQQAENALLADAYLELRLQTEELTGESLIFRTSEKEEEDRTIFIVKPESVEPETESTETGETESGEENQSESTDISESETESVGTTENISEITTEESEQLISEEEVEGESEIVQTEPETESETEEISVPISNFSVTVSWNHGTNDRNKWPTELALRFYEHEEDTEPVYTETISAPYAEEGGTGAESGEEEPETETEMTEEMTGDLSLDELEFGFSEEAELSEPVEDPEDPYNASMQIWNNIQVAWPEGRLAPNQYYMSVFVQNYIPTITWDGAAKHYNIQMIYLEPEESPLLKFNPLSELTFASGAEGMYYKGSGTADDPYVFFCTDGAIIMSSFVNWVLGFDELGTTRISDGCHVVLEIRESDSITGAFIRSIGLDGTIRVEYGYDPSTYWIFSSDEGIVKYQEEIPDDEMSDFEDFDPGWFDMGVTYTAEELAYAIEEKERELRQLRVDEKKANLDLKRYNKEMEESVVLSSVNGYVQSLGDTESSDAFMVVASETGLYVKSTVSEMDLDTVEKGQVINCTSWETGQVFSATITQIDYFPSSTSNSDYYWSGGNSNSSSYPILAVIDEEDVASEYESVSVQFPKENQMDSDSIYLEKAYIRSENGQSYVYITDENNLLKKQYIRTGGNSYGYVEIKEGLSNDDKIAFPYGKDVRPGAKTVDAYGEDY